VKRISIKIQITDPQRYSNDTYVHSEVETVSTDEGVGTMLADVAATVLNDAERQLAIRQLDAAEATTE
jgi:hypothetical protein